MSASHTATQRIPGLTHADVQQHDLSASGRKFVQIRVDRPTVTAGRSK
jgi:hypothetical protein